MVSRAASGAHDATNGDFGRTESAEYRRHPDENDEGHQDEALEARKREIPTHTDELSDDETYTKKIKPEPEPVPKPKKKRKDWVSGYETKNGRFLIGKWVRETLFYFLFLVAFTYTQFIGRNSSRINTYSKMWREILVDRTSNVSDVTGLVRFLNESVVHEFFAVDYFEKQYYPALGKSGSPFASALVGAAKVRQLRVKAVGCHSLHNKLVTQGTIKSTECYPSWTGSPEETLFSRAGAVQVNEPYPFFTYSPAKDTQESTFEGKYGVYHGGGFVAEITSANAAQTIRDLERLRFLDPKTRAVFFEFLAYSPNDDIFASCRVAFEFIPGGLAVPTVNVYGFLLDRYPEQGSSAKIGLEFWVYAMVVGYIIDEYRHFEHERWKRYMTISWVQLDVINYILFLAGAYYKAMYLRTLFSYLGADEQGNANEITAAIRQIAVSLSFQDQLAGANGFLLWIKLFKYVLVTRRLLRLGNTIAETISDVATFGFLFATVAYAFAVGGHVLFKKELDEFYTINSAARTMLRAVFGESLFERLIDAAGSSGYFYLLFWLIVSRTILLNVVISILHEAYQNVLAHEIANPSLTTYMKITNEFAHRREEQEKLLEQMEESQNKKKKGRSILINEDPAAEAKARLGWNVPVEERTWAPHGEHGASPPKKSPTGKMKPFV